MPLHRPAYGLDSKARHEFVAAIRNSNPASTGKRSSAARSYIAEAGLFDAAAQLLNPRDMRPDPSQVPRSVSGLVGSSGQSNGCEVR